VSTKKKKKAPVKKKAPAKKKAAPAKKRAPANAGKAAKKQAPAKAGKAAPATSSATLPSLIAEARRILAAWDAGEYDDATDAVLEADEMLRALKDSGEQQLLAALKKMCDDASKILVAVYGD
jgi:hypothetical protein